MLKLGVGDKKVKFLVSKRRLLIFGKVKMKKILVLIFGKFFSRIYALLVVYKNKKINNLIGGGKRIVQYPFTVSGVGNIVAGDSINIGVGATIFTKRAKL